MEWPVLGRKRSLVEPTEPPSKKTTSALVLQSGHSGRKVQTRLFFAEPPTKPSVKQRHWNLKLESVTAGRNLPEAIEKLIEGFFLSDHNRKFHDKYGNVRALYIGQGAISSWHPKVPSTIRERHVWDVFPAGQHDPMYLRDGSVRELSKVWKCEGPAPKPLITNEKTMASLQGKEALIVYKNRAGKTTPMDPKRIVEVRRHSMSVADGLSGSPFTLSYTGIQSVHLYIDLRK
jgi:hypothetical protein